MERTDSSAWKQAKKELFTPEAKLESLSACELFTDGCCGINVAWNNVKLQMEDSGNILH